MANVVGDSAKPEVPAVSGKHTANGFGVLATSEQGIAVRATAKKDTAIFATSDAGVGIDARSEQKWAVRAIAKKDTAIYATSDAGVGIDARSEQKWAVRAIAKIDTAVFASSDAGVGVDARSEQKWAVRAIAKKDTAVFASSDAGTGVDARSEKGIGVYGKGGTYAGYFEGIVMVTGDIQLKNADCAEDFEVASPEKIDEGTVMALNDAGQLVEGKVAYDKKVAGVVSGAGDLKPGLVLGRAPGRKDRVPIALMGRVYCKVDAGYEQVSVGDLLTTSPTPGHAMKATDPSRSFGAVIGKALQPLKSGKGMIAILVALQ